MRGGVCKREKEGEYYDPIGPSHLGQARKKLLESNCTVGRLSAVVKLTLAKIISKSAVSKNRTLRIERKKCACLAHLCLTEACAEKGLGGTTHSCAKHKLHTSGRVKPSHKERESRLVNEKLSKRKGDTFRVCHPIGERYGY